MPWKVSGVVERRKQFVVEYQAGRMTMPELCQAHGISRPTGDGVLRAMRPRANRGWRSRTGGHGGIPTRRRRRSSKRVLDLRREHPAWGPRKLQAKLEKAAPRLWRAGLTGGRGNVEITKSVIPLSA